MTYKKVIECGRKGWIKTTPGDNWGREKHEVKTEENGKSDKMT